MGTSGIILVALAIAVGIVGIVVPLLPGVEPTGRTVEIPTVAIVQFQGDKLVHEHIYWDQASVLVQLGLLAPEGLPIAGAETAHKVLDISLPSNTLMESARRRQ